MKKVKFRPSILRLPQLSLLLLLSFTSLSFSQETDSTASQEKDSTANPAVQAASSDDANALEGETPAPGGTSNLGDADNGKQLFNTLCASCHKPYSKMVGPALHGVTSDHAMDWLVSWIHNSSALIASGDAQAVSIYNEFNKTSMPPFPQLSTEDIGDILAYVEMPKPTPKTAPAVAGGNGAAASGGGGGASNDLILGILAFVLLMLLVILFLVNKTLHKFAASSGVEIPVKEKRTPIWQAFVQNQFLVLITSVFLLLIGAYWIYGYMMQIGIDQGYEPIQPIHYSHRIHAGDNKIDCKYCHSSARVSKTSGIPSLNVCMNCHKSISEVAPETATADYSKEYYDSEIAKLYDAVGWDPAAQSYTGETHPVKWVRIHNLPDLVYFNHSQHVSVAGVQCQHCHGQIENMEVVHQEAPLTMGWCINCHRETSVKMEDNDYYKKIHEELSKKYGVDKLTIAEMGGLECGKCHY